jgi:hypothetical protein
MKVKGKLNRKANKGKLNRKMNKRMRLRRLKRQEARQHAKQEVKQESNNQELPSKLQMAKNLGNSIVKNVAHVAKGERLKVTPEEAKTRMNTCLGCEFLVGDSNKERCKKCGCWLRMKTQFKAESCPVGKW